MIGAMSSLNKIDKVVSICYKNFSSLEVVKMWSWSSFLYGLLGGFIGGLIGSGVVLFLL